MSVSEYQLKSETEDPASLSLVKNEDVGLVGSDARASYTSVSLEPLSEIKMEVKTEMEVCYVSEGDLKYHCEDFTLALGDKGGDSLPAGKEAGKGKPFVCLECGKTFTKRNGLERHFRSHTGERPYTCNDCGKSFSRKSYLKAHMAIHTGERPFACRDCGKSFSEKSNLKHHMTIHSGERPFVCKDCGKSFSLKKHLKTHMVTHTGERPFTCKDCGKSFSHTSHLKTHVRIHLGEKPFACNECGKTFSRRNSLKRHFLTHKGEKPFACTDCGNLFLEKAHLEVHTGERSLICKDCSTSFPLEVHYESDGDVKHHSDDFTSATGGEDDLAHVSKEVDEEKPFVCKECGKAFSLRSDLEQHSHTQEGETQSGREEALKSLFDCELSSNVSLT